MKIQIQLKTNTKEEERVFNILESWLSENFQEYLVEVEGTKLKYERKKDG